MTPSTHVPNGTRAGFVRRPWGPSPRANGNDPVPYFETHSKLATRNGFVSKPMGSHFGVFGAPIFVFFTGWIESDVPWGYDLTLGSTHGQMASFHGVTFCRVAKRTPS